MTPVIVSVLMWLLVASLLILRRGRSERSITYAAVIIAASMTLNIDGVYRAIDRVLGGTNVATLVADVALMVGIFFLGRGVARATEYKPRVIQIALGRVMLGVALVSTILAFILLDRGETTTTFMLDFGDRAAAAAYSIVQYLYDAIVLTAMAGVAGTQLAMNRGVRRLPSASLLIGSLLGLTLCAAIVTMDVAHLNGNLTLMLTVGIAYGPLFLLTFAFLCLGLASQPAIRRASERSRQARTRELIRQLTPTWRRASQVRPGMSQKNIAVFQTEDEEARLHRQVVEIRDAMIDPRTSFELDEQQRALLHDAEAHLVGQDTHPTEAEGRSHLDSPKGAH